jgi:hypothetical protein
MLGLALGLCCASVFGAVAWPRSFEDELDELRAALETIRESGDTVEARAAEVDAWLAEFERALASGEDRPEAIGRLAWLASAALAVGFGLAGRFVDAGMGFVGAGLGAVLARRAAARRRMSTNLAREEADGLVSDLVPELLQVERRLPAGKRRRSRRGRS